MNDDIDLPLLSNSPMTSAIHKLIAHGVGKMSFFIPHALS